MRSAKPSSFFWLLPSDFCESVLRKHSGRQIRPRHLLDGVGHGGDPQRPHVWRLQTALGARGQPERGGPLKP